MKLQNHVKFLEYPERLPYEKMAKLFRSFDVGCVPSLSEGFGFNAVEYQACGIPVVACNNTSLTEVVKGGILVEPNSKDFADGIIKLLSDRALRKSLSKGGIKFIKKFNWNKTVDEHIKLYESLVN